jgi:hypothetical protein
MTAMDGRSVEAAQARWRLRLAERAVDSPWSAPASARIDHAVLEVEALERRAA